MRMKNNITRCEWANQSEIEQNYHDTEWGHPEYDDLRLFQMLNLEGMQAGLSWSTILNKRAHMLIAFDQFDPDIVIHYDDNKITELLNDPGIIRNRLKVNAVVTNAKCYFLVKEKYGSFNDFLWQYVDYATIINSWDTWEQVPSSTLLSDKISKDMKKIGFKFVGSTIIYAYMQSIGMVNDHLATCSFR